MRRFFPKKSDVSIFNAVFNFFLQNKLYTPCQPGFIPADSYVSQYYQTCKKFTRASIATHPLPDISKDIDF